MKKVLALVLAVIMVCTMAMAVTVPNVDIANATLGTTSDKYGTVTLNASNIDKEGYAYVDLGTTIFSLLKGSTATTSDITAKTFKITVTATPAVTVAYGENGGAYLRILAADKPLDGKVEYSISSVKVEKIGAGTNYATIVADKGVLVMDTVVLNGNTVYSVSKEIGDASNYKVELNGQAIPAAWDVGYPTSPVADAGTLVAGWNKASEKATVIVPSTGALCYDGDKLDCGKITMAKDATVKMSAYADTDAVWTKAKNTATDAIAKAATKQKLVNETPVFDGGIVLTEATTFTLAYGDNVNLYTLNKDGTLSASAFKFVDGKGWQLTAKEMPITVVTNAKMTTVAGTTTETGTTTNPGTGANDVVGVAAALAVVALVSGAAISLKK